MYKSIAFAVAAFVGFVIGATELSAQFQKRILPADSAALVESAIVSDTGRMLPGYKDLRAYDTPSYCLSLMKSLERYIWRAGERDTISPMSIDTAPTQVIEKGRECISKFTPQSVASYELPNYLQVASVLRDTALMRTVVNQVLNSDKLDTTYKIHFLADAGKLAVGLNKPNHSEFSLSIVKQLKTYGVKSVKLVLDMYLSMRNNYILVDDTFGLNSLSKESLDYISSFSDEQLKDKKGYIKAVYRDIYEDSISRIWFEMPKDFAEQIIRLKYLATDSSDDMLLVLDRELTTLKTTLIGKLPSDMELVAAFPSTATAVPEKGKVTLYFRQYSISSNNNLEGRLANLLRLKNKYGDRLEIVLVTAVRGNMWDSPPLTPEAEAKLHAWYYQDYHGLPFTILVNTRPILKRRDGRLLREKPLFDDFLGSGNRNRGYLVGKDGTIQAFDGMQSEKFIERELAK